MKKKILAISGSTRKESSNASILNNIAALYKDRLDIEIYDKIDTLPHFSPDLDKEEPPAAVNDFRNRIQSSDGILICTPEYVFSLPGSLKNAIEWNVSTTLFSEKPVAIIVAAASGRKAFESLDLIMTTIESKIDEKSKLLIQAAKSKIATNGEVTDQQTLNSIKRVVESLIASVNGMNDNQT